MKLFKLSLNLALQSRRWHTIYAGACIHIQLIQLIVSVLGTHAQLYSWLDYMQYVYMYMEQLYIPFFVAIAVAIGKSIYGAVHLWGWFVTEILV